MAVPHPYWNKFKGHIGKELNIFGKGWRGAKVAVGLDLMMAAADIAGSTYESANEWAARSGQESDYYAGGWYGFHTAAWRNGFGTAGAWLGGAVGGGIGALIPLPGAAFVGGIVGGFVGWTIGEQVIGTFVEMGIRREALVKSEIGRTALTRRRVNFGGNFRDSREAMTMRQRAVQEMAGSLLNARQYLGNEAAFMHA